METKNAFLLLLAVVFLAFVVPGLVPPGQAGGTEDGTEILPYNDDDDDGNDDDGRSWDDGDGPGGLPPGTPVAFHSDSSFDFVRGNLQDPALVLSRPEADRPSISLEAFVKAPWTIALDQSSEDEVEAYSIAGRYEVRDLDPFDDESLILQAGVGNPGVAVVLIGRRRTDEGPILHSFERIDYTSAVPLGEARLDLRPLRDALIGVLGGHGFDVAVMVAERGSNRRAIAAFNSDDLSMVYDLEARRY